MTAREIVEELGRTGAVERMVINISHGAVSPDLADLSQMVYEILLCYDEGKIVSMWESGQLRFFLARVILNQLHSQRSPFHALYREFGERSESIRDVHEGKDEEEI